jgi:hypothetical protein
MLARCGLLHASTSTGGVVPSGIAAAPAPAHGTRALAPPRCGRRLRQGRRGPRCRAGAHLPLASARRRSSRSHASASTSLGHAALERGLPLSASSSSGLCQALLASGPGLYRLKRQPAAECVDDG